MQEKALHPVTGTQQRAWEDADEGEREHEGALCTGIYRHNIQETAERTVRKPSAFCERRHSTLSIRPIVLNVKLLTRFHTVFGTVSICRSTKTLGQRGPAPSSVSLPGPHTTWLAEACDSASSPRLCRDLEQQMSWEVGEAGKWFLNSKQLIRI